MFRALLGRLGMALTVVFLLGCWLVLLAVGVPILTAIGISEQSAAGAVSVLFFVAFWAVGLTILFGGSAGKERVRSDAPAEADHDKANWSLDTPESDRDQQARTLRHNWWHVIAFAAVGSLVSPVVTVLAVAFKPEVILWLPDLLAVLPGLLLFVAIAVPPAFYFDAKYVRAVNDEWHPDSRLYGLVGVAVMVLLILRFLSLVVVLAAVPCLWYLSKRHVHVGVP